MKKIFTIHFLFFVAATTIAQQKITIRFNNKVGEKNLRLATETYYNAFGEPFTINKFRYYISKIVLIDINGKKYSYPNDYFLIDEADSTSKTIKLTTVAKHITGIQFLIGVDSIKNVSGVQTGSLDPMKGMFWTWNTGYVFAKLEGQSDSSHAPSHYFSYHVGGFRKNENALRFVRLDIGENIKTNNRIINITADVLKWFNTSHPIKIMQSAICHQPGILAIQLADNYSNMFTITHN